MRVLAVGEFDPAGVMLGHRRALRAQGIDYRYAVQDVYWHGEGEAADWWLRSPNGCDFAGLRAFADTADIIQFSPAIGQPWSCEATGGVCSNDTDVVPFGPINWREIGHAARRVAFFHGSVNAWANADGYVALYRQDRQWPLLTSSVRYAMRMGAKLTPPIVAVSGPQAALRGDDDPLRIIHASTDSRLNNTDDFIAICRALNVQSTVISGAPHADVLALKRAHHAAYDHLRGVPSVSTIENAALGLACFVGTRPDYAAYLKRALGVTLPWPVIEHPHELMMLIEAHVGDPEATRALQRACLAWYQADWAPARLADRLITVYQSVL